MFLHTPKPIRKLSKTSIIYNITQEVTANPNTWPHIRHNVRILIQRHTLPRITGIARTYIGYVPTIFSEVIDKFWKYNIV